MIGACLDSLSFCDEILVVDTGNTDTTNNIARSKGAKIVVSHGTDYSQFRNDGLKKATGDWVLYVDADERVSPRLQADILQIVATDHPGAAAYALARTNVFLGRPMRYGGWGGEYIVRLFVTDHLLGWENPLHEQPRFKGRLDRITSPLLHYSHRDLSSMLEKTLEFTSFEASLRFNASHPPMVWWRFFRVMLTEFWQRFVRQSAWRDGTEGIIDGMFQVFNTFIIYARLWEMQQKNHAR